MKNFKNSILIFLLILSSALVHSEVLIGGKDRNGNPIIMSSNPARICNETIYEHSSYTYAEWFARKAAAIVADNPYYRFLLSVPPRRNIEILGYVKVRDEASCNVLAEYHLAVLQAAVAENRAHYFRSILEGKTAQDQDYIPYDVESYLQKAKDNIWGEPNS